MFNKFPTFTIPLHFTGKAGTGIIEFLNYICVTYLLSVMKKQIQWFIVVLIAGLYIAACQGKKSEAATADNTLSSPPPPSPVAALEEGKKIFNTYCILCHGADGKLGLNGSKDLTISTITTEERITQVTNGKGLMTPFKEILNEAEIKAVVGYVESLKK